MKMKRQEKKERKAPIYDSDSNYKLQRNKPKKRYKKHLWKNIQNYLKDIHFQE